MADTIVASLLVLRQKIHSFHWMVTGISFHELHLLAGEQYVAVLEFADRVAEYLRTMNMTPPLTLRDMIELSIIDDSNIGANTDMKIEVLANDFLTLATYVDELPEESKAFSNIMGDLHEYLMKQHWFLSSYLK